MCSFVSVWDRVRLYRVQIGQAGDAAGVRAHLYRMCTAKSGTGGRLISCRGHDADAGNRTRRARSAGGRNLPVSLAAGCVARAAAPGTGGDVPSVMLTVRLLPKVTPNSRKSVSELQPSVVVWPVAANPLGLMSERRYTKSAPTVMAGALSHVGCRSLVLLSLLLRRPMVD